MLHASPRWVCKPYTQLEIYHNTLREKWSKVNISASSSTRKPEITVLFRTEGFFTQRRKERKKMKSLSRVWAFATPWTVACQVPLSMGFSRQEYWSGLLFPSPGDLPGPGIEPGSPTLQADSLLSESPGNPYTQGICYLHLFLIGICSSGAQRKRVEETMEQSASSWVL